MLCIWSGFYNTWPEEWWSNVFIAHTLATQLWSAAFELRPLIIRDKECVHNLIKNKAFNLHKVHLCIICSTLMKLVCPTSYIHCIVCPKGAKRRTNGVKREEHLFLSCSLHAPVNLIQKRNENTIQQENHFTSEENTNTKAWIRPWSHRPLSPPLPFCPHFFASPPTRF